jgi:uncharacterized protein (TIGR02996 family)
MSLEPALLAAIAAAPDDDLPRLVYADWLDENDRPLRAEFIRLQIEIAKKETLPRAAVNVFAHLWQRQQEILDDHRDELLGPLAGVVTQYNYEFRRGFLEQLTLRLSDFLDNIELVGALRPPPAVRVIDAADSLEHLATADHLELITELQVEREVTLLQGGFGSALTADLIEARTRLTRLRLIDLENCRLGDANMPRLFTTTTFPALVELDLSFNDLTDAGVIDLLNTGVPQRLKRLVLGGNPIGDQAAMELADRLGGSKVLESLNLRMTNIGPNGQAALLARLGGKVDLF